jgi:hypothetical protein
LPDQNAYFPSFEVAVQNTGLYMYPWSEMQRIFVPYTKLKCFPGIPFWTFANIHVRYMFHITVRRTKKSNILWMILPESNKLNPHI